MNQVETVALFERCEKARGQARAQSLADGKSDDDARVIAHEAAKAVWNGWAEHVLVNLKRLEKAGCCDADKDVWISTAKANFSSSHFLSGKARVTPADNIGESETHEIPLKPVFVENVVIDFSDYIFPGDTTFNAATFSGDALFTNVTFSSHAFFVSAIFSGNATFDDAIFSGKALFPNATFFKGAYFSRSEFCGTANFALMKTHRMANFDTALFHGPAVFSAIRGERGFSMDLTRFEHVPDFIQAHFEEAPGLDNVEVVARMTEPPGSRNPVEDEPLPENASRLRKAAWRYRYTRRVGWHYCRHGYPRRWAAGACKRVLRADKSIPARWRALKRLAIQGHDGDREHEFFAREIRSARFATDWPLPLGRPSFSTSRLKWLNNLPLVFWRLRLWAGFFRFWFGTLYGLFSDYGRSVVIPFAWWIAAIGIGAMAYLGEHRGWIGDTDATHYESVFAPVRPMVRFYDDWRVDRPCFTPFTYQGSRDVTLSGLSDELRNQTSAPNEALHLAFRNAFLVLDGGEEAAHRIYGCLYGLELYNHGDPVPIVPPGVSFTSAVQKIFSAVMIFLFGLALRNMLKMK